MTSTPSTTELVTVGAPIALRDGSRVRVRRGHRSDRELLLRGFERLSAESRYRRFLAPMPHQTESMIRYLTEIDHRDHEAVSELRRKRPVARRGRSQLGVCDDAGRPRGQEDGPITR